MKIDINNTNEIMEAVVNCMRENKASSEKIAQMEIAMQYLGNPNFRQWLEDFVFKATYKKSEYTSNC